MTYSVNAFMPFEGYRLAFNGEKGRLEIRDYERQPFEVPARDRDLPHEELRQAADDCRSSSRPPAATGAATRGFET